MSWAVGPGYRVHTSKVNIAREVLDRHIEADRGQRVAVKWSGGCWTYDDLYREVGRFAAGLKKLGVGKGAKILVRSRNLPETIAAVLATYKLGAVPVWVNSLLQEAELEYILDNSEARHAVCMEELAGALRSLKAKGLLDAIIILDGDRPDAEGEYSYRDLLQEDGDTLETADTDALDPAFMLYSSGTTGRPKGILHAHRWIITVGDPALVQIGFEPDDIVMTSSEFSFMGTFAHALHFVLYAGSTIALYNDRARPEQVLAAIEEAQANIFMSVPTLYRAVLANPDLKSRFDLSAVRMMISTGELLGAATYEQWMAEYAIPLIEVYGVSEVEVLIGNSLAFPVKPGSIGKALPGFNLALLNSALEPVGPNQEGVLMIHRSDPGLYLTYYRAPERWRAQHRGDWYYTGDVMMRDEDGYYWYLGRDDDLFKSRGYFLSPQEIENALVRHPNVAEAAVIGLPDDAIGNRVAAYVVLVSDMSPSEELQEEILEFVRGFLAPYKVPKQIEFLEAIPKNPVGKILRRALRERA